MSVRRKRLYHGIGNYVWGRCTAMEWRVWYLLVSAVRLSCLQSSGAIERLGGPQNTPQWHHNIVPGRLPAYWKTQGRNFFMPEIGAVRILLRKTLQCDASNGRQATRPDATWCESAVKRNLQKQTHTHTQPGRPLSGPRGARNQVGIWQSGLRIPEVACWMQLEWNGSQVSVVGMCESGKNLLESHFTDLWVTIPRP